MGPVDRNLLKNALLGDDQREQLVQSLARNLTDSLLDMGVARSCLNCDHWNTDGSYGNRIAWNQKFPEGCIKFQRLPPPKVIVVGCEHHSEQIPF